MLPTQALLMPVARVPGEETWSPFTDREPAQEAQNMQIVVNLGRLGQDQGGKQSPVSSHPIHARQGLALSASTPHLHQSQWSLSGLHSLGGALASGPT